MKTPAIRKLRQKLKSDQPVYGLWVTLESASITEMAVALGLDWVVIDAEHGHLDWHEILEHVRSTVRSDTVVLVRVADLNAGLIKRALDIGADGVVVPWIETADQMKEAVCFAQYPPAGVRGIGAERATCWGKCFGPSVQEANEHVLVVPIIESVRGGKNIDAICRVPGTELIFLGPADFSSTAGYPGQWEGPGVAEQILAVKDTARRHGKHCGIVATSNENIAFRRQQGFRMLCVGIDGALLLRSLGDSVESLGRAATIAPTFVPENQSLAPKIAPLPAPPPDMKPDRPEKMTTIGTGPKLEIDRGVIFEATVGNHNGARNLTTGIVTFAPHAQLKYHTHEFTESVTLLEGEATIDIEGRRYNLSKMDNVVIPKGLAHQVRNTGDAPALFHVAMGSHEPNRTLVERFFRRNMPDDSTGMPGAERVNRFATAKRFEAGAGATFIDFFNRDLIEGIEMSGGYGLFKPGGRLPCHLHDFDESICIIQGTATCIVEGRRYQMSDSATALQPRGRCHYFVNESNAPMAMIWVYAGPVPERLVLDERNCTPQGNPWQGERNG
jgi:2-keto-3-deoxy-L-rhamnonate aldolase RhmA/quercetin dioxygenase-like cupin family protein